MREELKQSISRRDILQNNGHGFLPDVVGLDLPWRHTDFTSLSLIIERSQSKSGRGRLFLFFNLKLFNGYFTLEAGPLLEALLVECLKLTLISRRHRRYQRC